MRKIGEKQSGNSLIRGAAIIAAGGFISKIVGALYRIPLTNLLGGRGMGLYGLVYPVYCLLLTISATGIPNPIAKLVAEKEAMGESGKNVLITAMKLFIAVGLAGTLLMCAAAPLLSLAQGQNLSSGYFVLAPSVVLVSALSVFRGYFQGKNQMLPTALSEIAEQIIKVGFGFLLAFRFRNDIKMAVVMLLLSVSISEAITLLGMIFYYKRRHASSLLEKNESRVAMKNILRLSAPVAMSALILPITGLIESVLIVRLLARHTGEAITLYGLFTGGAITIINLPVSVAYGIAAASVPAVSKAKKEDEDSGGYKARKKVLFSLLLTLAVSIPCALLIYFFSPMAVKVLFKALSAEEKSVLVWLTKILSLSVIFLSSAQTLSACLTGLGKPKYSLISTAISSIVRLLLDSILIGNAKISVLGCAIAADIAYLVAFLLDLMYNLRITKRKKRMNEDDYGSRIGSECGRSDEKGQGSYPLGEKSIRKNEKYPLL